MVPPPLLAATSVMCMGGSSTFLLNIATVVQEKGGHFPIVCFANENELASEFTALQMPVHCLKGRNRIFEDTILEAYEEVARQKPKAVMACLGSQSFELLRMLPPGVVRIGVIQSHDPGPYGVIEGYRKWLDVVVGVSPTIATHLVEKSGFAKSVFIPYGIQFSPPEERIYPPPSEPLRLIYLGRMVEVHKKVSRLVELVQRLDGEGVAFHFQMVGTGPEEDYLRRELARFSQVEFLKPVANGRVKHLMRKNDVLVLLSDYEGLPLSLLESMGEGVVPVISDLESGVREIVSEKIGFRVPVGDVAAAASAIKGLAADRGRLEELSKNCVELARREYSAKQMTERFVDLVDSFPVKNVTWPENVVVPRPQFVKPGWLYEGFPRQLRRWRKRFAAATS